MLLNNLTHNWTTLWLSFKCARFSLTGLGYSSFGFCQLKSHIALQRKLEVLRLLLEGGADGRLRYDHLYTPPEIRLIYCFHSASSVSTTVGSSSLPPKPSIFYGREELVDGIVKNIVKEDSAKIAVLGPGGVGKVRVGT